jgi:hypothetical protein
MPAKAADGGPLLAVLVDQPVVFKVQRRLTRSG